MKLLHVVAARPQFMKLHPLLKELNKTDIISEVLHTGQHFDKNMSDVFFSDMRIPKPNYNLNLRSSSVSNMLEEITKVLVEENFDSVLVYGDTNSTLVHGGTQKKGFISLNGGKDWAGAANDTIQLIFDGSYWYEVCRSDNTK